VLDAKGGENKGQSDKWISYHLRDFGNSRVEIFALTKLFYCLSCQKLVSCGEKCWLWEKGEFLESWIKFLWKTSLYVSTSAFDLKIGFWVWFAKTNQVVAKDDP
jgi:hypothetical protein